MKRALVAAALLTASCSVGPEDAAVALPESVEHEDIAASPEGSLPVEYLPFCIDERRALGPWLDSQDAAEDAAGDHETMSGWHRCQILWRQRP